MIRKTIICLTLTLVSYTVLGQIKVSEFIQYSKTASSEENALYFIDFWATWCGPCITAKEQLGVLQRQFPNDFYIVSLSKENSELVKRFIEKKPTDLAIAIDYYGQAFRAYNIRSLPNGILFNANGDVLWQGSSPDLTADIISKFLRRHKTKVSIESFFDIVASKTVTTREYTPTKAIEIQALEVVRKDLIVSDKNGYLKLSGPLEKIAAYLYRVNDIQIVLDNTMNAAYNVFFKKPLSENQSLQLLKALDLEVKKEQSKGEVLTLEITDASLFWDTNQINWDGTNKYLISDSNISADNVPLKDISYQLSKILELPVIIEDEDRRSYTKHDWDIHYKYFELMRPALEDTYGIKVERKQASYPIYNLTKKAP